MGGGNLGGIFKGQFGRGQLRVNNCRETVGRLFFFLRQDILGNGQNTVTRVLFWRRELTEPH